MFMEMRRLVCGGGVGGGHPRDGGTERWKEIR